MRPRCHSGGVVRGTARLTAQQATLRGHVPGRPEPTYHLISFRGPRVSRSDATTPAARTKKAAAKSDPPARTRRRSRDQEVLEAAIQIFWEKGYANASVQDVADSLGMLKGSLYYYTDSKESLLLQIFDDSHREIIELTEAVMAGPGHALERMSNFLREYAMWTLTHVERAGLYSREWRYVREEKRGPLQEHQRYYDKVLRGLIVAGQEEGVFDSTVDPKLASRYIWAAFTSIPDWYRPGRQKAADVAEEYVELALNAVGAVR